MHGLAKFARSIDAVNELIGRAISWSALFLVFVQFGIVIINYLYSEGSIAVQESLTYMHSLLFLGAAGYTLLHNGHVRVDVFYGKMNEKTRAFINLFGSLFILFPVLIIIGIYAWPYVSQSWSIMEGSTESSGLHLVYLLKSMILLFVASMFIQGVSISVHSILTIAGFEHLVEERLEEGV